MIYEGVRGNRNSLRYRLKIGEYRVACGSIEWNSTPQHEELRDIWFKKEKFSPRVRQYLQGFLRSKGL